MIGIETFSEQRIKQIYGELFLMFIKGELENGDIMQARRNVNVYIKKLEDTSVVNDEKIRDLIYQRDCVFEFIT